jgi:hypothetical protein
MAICMKMDAGHIHEAACDEAVANGRTTTVVAVRISDDKARAVRELIHNSSRGYASVSEFINHLIESQALRRRGTQLTDTKACTVYGLA